MPACQTQLAPRGSLVTSRAKPARKDGPTAPPSQQQRKPAQPQAPGGQQQQQSLGDDDGEGDGFLDLDEFEEDEGEGGEDFDEDSEAVEEFDAEGLGLEPDDAERVLQTGNEAWGEVALRAAQDVLSKPGMAGLELFLFKALPGMKKIDVRLDKLDDLYGSPSIDDIERFSRALSAELEAVLGLEAAGEIMFEVSSPGAERELKLPDELDRFSELPLKVEYVDDKGAASSGVLQLVSYDTEAGVTVWRLADVKANAPVKGRGMSKKQQQLRFTIPVAAIKKARVFVDFGLLLQ